MSRLLYADLGKKATDLLTKDFPDKTKVEVNARAANGLQFQTIATRNHDGSIVGSLQPKYTFVKQGVTVSTTIDTNRVAKVEATVENSLPGLKATVGGQSDTESFKADFEYKHDLATITTGLDFFSPKGNTVAAAAVFNYEGFSLGGSTEYFIADKQEFRKADAVAAYSTPDLQLTAFSKRKGEVLGGSYYQRISATLGIAAEIGFDLRKADVTPKLTFGGTYSLDAPSASTVKGKFDTDGKLSLSYGQKLNSLARFTVGSTINTNNLGASGNHTIGFSVVFDL
jgi:hypothetical protein